MATKIIALDSGHALKTPGKQTPDGIKEWTLNDKVRDYVVDYLKDYDVKFVFPDNNEGSKDEVYSVIVPDATACCQQGIEFFYDFKNNKPKANSEITVTGIFNVHMLNEGISYNFIKAEKIQ